MNKGKICISVCAETADEMIAKIKLAERLADVIEVRFDCLDRVETKKCRFELSKVTFDKPLLATFRSPDQGGKNNLSHEERAAFWLEKDTSFWAVDVEEDIVEATTNWPKRILSFHDFENVTTDLENTFERLSSYESDFIKIAVRAADITGSIPVWEVIEIAETVGKPVIPIGMGEAGKWTRILGLAHGAYMTYASLDECGKTADGQITAKDLIEVYRVKELDKNTDVYGVIGDPVSSSLSPYMHNAAFAATGINAVFLPLLVKNLDEFMLRMVASATREVELNFAGFSVTMPHKQTIIKYLDEVDEVAKKVGAVNTVKIVDGKLIGYNTDVHGFIVPLKTKFGDIKNARVTVIGAGGVARACVYALQNEGADVTVLVRDVGKAATFADEFNVKVEQLSGDHRPLVTDVVVNATPLGMKGAFEDVSPLTSEQLEGVKFVYDLVTRSGETPLIVEAKKISVPAIGGIDMLIAQGVRQFEIWTEGAAPIEAMEAAVLKRIR